MQNPDYDAAIVLYFKRLPLFKPLREAMWRRDVATIRELLASGAYVNLLMSDYDPKLRTVLHHASIDRGQIAIVSVLIEGGADLDIQDAYGYTALHLAASNLHDDAVLALLNAGAAVNTRDKDGRTALYYASISNKKGAKLLRSPLLRRTNVLARVARFTISDVDVDFSNAQLYARLLDRMLLLLVTSRAALADIRLVCKAWRLAADRTLAARPVEFFAPKQFGYEF